MTTLAPTLRPLSDLRVSEVSPRCVCALAAGRRASAPLSALVALKHMHSMLMRFVLEPSYKTP